MRTYWAADLCGEDSATDPIWQNRRRVSNPAEANLISSLTESGEHMPVLDFDIPARLIPSSTPGHSHLFIDKVVSWRDYRRVLKALAKAGLIESGFYRMSKRRGASFLRTHKKGERDVMSAPTESS